MQGFRQEYDPQVWRLLSETRSAWPCNLWVISCNFAKNLVEKQNKKSDLWCLDGKLMGIDHEFLFENPKKTFDSNFIYASKEPEWVLFKSWKGEGFREDKFFEKNTLDNGEEDFYQNPLAWTFLPVKNS